MPEATKVRTRTPLTQPINADTPRQVVDLVSDASRTRGVSLTELLVSLTIVLILAATALHYGMETVARVRTILGFE